MSRDTKPWLPLYVADFLVDETVKLAGNRALGAYVKLLCHQWTHRSVPADAPSLARLVGESEKDWNKLWQELREKFPERNGRRVNPRLEVERRKADKVLCAQRRAARSTNRSPARSPLRSPTRSPGVQSQSQSQSHNNNYTPVFEEAWTAYPRRHGGNSKRAAYRQWQARVAEGVSEAALLAGTKRYATECQDKLGTPYVKQAATFYGRDRHFEYEELTRISRDAAIRRAFDVLRVVDESRVPRDGFETEAKFAAWLAVEQERAVA